MSQLLSRSYSVNQNSRPVTRSPLVRSVSNNAPSNNESPSSKTAHALVIKNDLADGNAQMVKFIKEYPQNWDLWNTTIALSYVDAEQRLPRIAARLDKCRLESLLLVKNIIKTMGDNIVKSLKPSAQKDEVLSKYLARAQHATENAMILCVNGTRFEKPEQKDLYSSNDIVSAAILVQRYLENVTNELGK